MRYYPIGTVVTLAGGDRPLMIYGRRQKQQTTCIEWDYVACLYPEGNLDEENTVSFKTRKSKMCCLQAIYLNMRNGCRMF